MLRGLLAAICTIYLVVASRAAAADPARTRVALVIGNTRYEAAIGPLRNAVNDAKSVAKALRELGFAVIEEHNVTRDELIEAVADFRGRIPGTAVALFYFAGHGISIGGSNYLIPVKSGYQPAGGNAIAGRLLAETRLFNAEQVVAEMSAAGGGCNLVILDACRNTPVARDPSARDAVRGGLAEMKPPAGSLIAFATDAGHTALDGEGRNGLYTGELVKHLQTPGITIEQVFKRTRAGVMRESGGKQVPAEYSRLVGEDIYLAGTASPEPAVPTASMAPRAERVEVPDFAAIRKLAAAGETAACMDALRLVTAANGPSAAAALPIDTLLELAKERLKTATGPSPDVDFCLNACTAALDAMETSLPADHPRRAELAGKAHNRIGDCRMLSGNPEQALPSYQLAVELLPDDAYPRYNRGRALHAVGRTAEARADFEAAAGPQFHQPAARALARTALQSLAAE